jgi:hypothetical protein
VPAVPAGARRALYALGLLGCSVAIFAFGVRADDSVLYGNASLPALILHSFGFYTAGAAVLEAFRS